MEMQNEPEEELLANRQSAENSDESDIELEGTDEITSTLMVQPFDPTQINIETKTPSLDTLIKRIKNKSVELNTESYFQRKDDLWDVVKQSRLIESILIRFPLPAFFFDATDDGKWLVVDGLQRLSSIRNFCVDRSLRLTKLEFLSHLNGMSWDDLSGDLQRLIEESQVVIYKIMPGTPSDVKFNIFRRINTGGLVLEAQEIRHALFQGRPADFIAKLAKNPEFLKATDWRIKTHRMLDRDFANRFLGFYLLGVENYGTKEFGGIDLDAYMSKAMESLYSKTESELATITCDFAEAMKLSYAIFGKAAFRKVYKNHAKLPPINKAIFDALSVQFALLDDTTREVVKADSRMFKEGLKDLLNSDEYFFTSVTSSTGDRNRVQHRHKKVAELIQTILDQ